MRTIGVLTGGGDAPGLNPAIKGLVYRASEHGIKVVGLYDGWRGLLDPMPEVLPLDRGLVRRWDRDGGTNLGSSRTNPFHSRDASGAHADRSREVVGNISRLALDAVVACGGEDTLGFDTALRNVTEIIDRSRTPAGSHGWVQIVEVMGRHAGHLALWSGVAGQADLVLIPEHPFSYRKVYRHLRERLGDTTNLARDPARPRYSVVVVAEGAHSEEGELVTVDAGRDAFGHARLGGVGESLARRIMSETPYDARSVMIGHPQRGGAPSPVDRVMGMMFGARAADAVAGGQYGKMVSARGVAPACELSLVDLGCVLGGLNTVDVERHYDTDRYHLKGIGM